jgi:alpha-mannosidase
MNRIDVGAEWLPEKPKPKLKVIDNNFYFKGKNLEVIINGETGLVDTYKINGKSILRSGAFCPIVIRDQDDAWGSQVQSFPEVVGKFKRMSKSRAQRYSGVKNRTIESVRVIEDGEARTVVEALMYYGDSSLCLTYKLPKQGTRMEVEVVVHWNEKAKMLKLAVPTVFEDSKYRGQVAYGCDSLPSDGREVVSQKWNAVVSERNGMALTCINDGTYGSDLTDNEMRLTLLRSPGYSALPGGNRKNTMAQDRFSDRIDQGERRFRFWFDGGPLTECLEHIDRKALALNEKPYSLTYFPSGDGEKVQPLVRLQDETIQITAIKQAEKTRPNSFVIRLFEPTGEARSTTMELPLLGMQQALKFTPFEIKTVCLDVEKRQLKEIPLMEMDIE